MSLSIHLLGYLKTSLSRQPYNNNNFAIRAGSVTVLGYEHANKVIWSSGSLPEGPGVGR